MRFIPLWTPKTSYELQTFLTTAETKLFIDQVKHCYSDDNDIIGDLEDEVKDYLSTAEPHKKTKKDTLKQGTLKLAGFTSS